MKVSGIGPLQGVGSATSVSKTANTQGSGSLSGGTTVSMSKDAAWIESLRASGQQLPPVRTELVSEIRQQLNAGTFEDSVDMDAVVNAFLSDF